MTVHARRYGRWCRQHFDHPEPVPGEPAQEPVPTEDARVPEAEREPVGEGRASRRE
ncbi:hypothetical protein [Amycolatopsis jejuensis]|uniref:hypothetical protein n=1 Tax=Amycolatopsis jejuensis TaxID=330084 RepID=UPI0012E00B48|nr:hypothetical protein [Amycolatopsis jejuensis]